MNPYYIEIFITILGLGTTSGLHYQNDEIKLISDNSNYFFAYNITDSKLTKTLLYDNEKDNEEVAKGEKFDFESIFKYNDNFYLLGSGSSDISNRNTMFVVDKDNNITRKDMSELYHRFQMEAGIAKEDFNIEGAFIHKERYYFLNRGNGPNKRNGIILSDIALENKVKFIPIDLSSISDNLSFTDGTIVENYLYFTATIENSSSTYADGEVKGSYVGYINLSTLALENIVPVSDTSKFEGISLYKNDEKTLEFLLCEDPDNKIRETTIHKLTFVK